MACVCNQCRPEWFRNGWWCPASEGVIFREPRPPSQALAGCSAASQVVDFPDEVLRQVLDASLRTAEADRRYQEELLRAIRLSLSEDSGSAGPSGSQDAPATSELTGKCIICMDFQCGGIICSCAQPSTAHFVCVTCLPQYVSSELESDEESVRRLMERRACGHCLRCPNRSTGCEGFLTLESLQPLLPVELWSRLQATAEADENHRQWQSQLTDEERPEDLQEALLRTMPNAVQCGGCGYGPIDYTGCEDLVAHHGEWHGQSRIANECPRCGWWQYDIREWPRWAGVVDLSPAHEDRVSLQQLPM